VSKGFDVHIGPDSPSKESEGYGFQWIALNNGRPDILMSGVWNIAKIRTAKVTLLHHSDPFPADGLADYSENLFPKEDIENNLLHLRKSILSWPSRFAQNSALPHLNMEQFYSDHPRAKDAREVFVCHMLRKQLGDEKFFKLVKTYVNLRQKSKQAVSPTHFQKLAEDVYGEPLDWFFKQWVKSTKLPRLELEKVTANKDKKGWQVQGRLLQSGETIFQLPVELAIDTKNGKVIQRLYVDRKIIDFDQLMQNEPQKLVVDPDDEILKIQRMPPRLLWFWDDYLELIIIYGTLGDTEANKTAAERFNKEYLGLGHETIKADIDVNEADLKTKYIVLFGRPETNKITQQFKDIFPIKFDEDKFTWQGVTYAHPTHGVAQIVETPNDPQTRMIMYAGLSPEATQKFWYLYLYDTEASWVIFDGDKELVSGDWKNYDDGLIWNFE
jgi:hypothetical protein